MSDAQLTSELAKRVMHWRVGPDRFLKTGREWIRRSEFEPLHKIDHAFRLLEQAAPQEYSMGVKQQGPFCVRVCIKGVIGEASDPSKAVAITHAVARAIGINVGSRE
jgi:hypothetical protein